MLDERRSKIMVVEDFGVRRELVAHHLGGQGYWVFEANRLSDSDVTGADDDDQVSSVASLLAIHSFHVAVIDLSLKLDDELNRQGFEVITSIQRLRENTEVIVLTAYGKPEDYREVFRNLKVFDSIPNRLYEKVEFLKSVEGAVAKARIPSPAINDNALEFRTLATGMELRAVAERLQDSGHAVSSLLAKALRPYLPYDRTRKVAEFISVPTADATRDVLRIKLWSRYLGSGIVVLVGSNDSIHMQRGILEQVGKRPGIDFEVVYFELRDRIHLLLQVVPESRPETFIPLDSDPPTFSI